MVRIGLLLADIPPESIVKSSGDYTHLFSQLLTSASRQFNPPVSLQLESFKCYEQIFPSNDNISTFDAFLISGSKFSAYDNDVPWIVELKEFVRKLFKDYPKVKIIGICFGHQIIAEALGGKVTKNSKGWEVGHTNIDLTDDGKMLLRTEKTMINLHQMHQDHVETMPPGFVNLASTAISFCQAMMLPNKILSVQAHPEFVPDVVRQLIEKRSESGIFSREDANKWLDKVDNPTDGIWFATKIISFIIDIK